MPNPWRSAFAQAELLEALILLDRVHPRLETKKLITKYFESFIPQNRKYEVVAKDNLGYLWFDEMPLPDQEKSSFIINGHIAGIYALYHYFNYSHDDRAKKILDSGIETVKSNFLFFHVKDGINCYDIKECREDYAPERILKQMSDLFKITHDPAFSIAYQLFKTANEQAKRRKKLENCLTDIASSMKCLWDQI